MNFLYIKLFIPEYILSIDPAGYGRTGIVIYDFRNFQLVAHFSFYSSNFIEAIRKFKNELINFKQIFKKENKTIFIPKYVILENYELWNFQKLKQPTSTPKALGGYISLLEHYFCWKDIILQSPRCKINFAFSLDRLKINDEADAFYHIYYFLNHYFTKN